ncbi:Os05g0219800, partial [Oryza sativa Japonica Group]
GTRPRRRDADGRERGKNPKPHHHQRARAPPPPPRRDFPAFPFAPYPIQSEFMSFLYGALSSGPGALALLESPTGTGKTLSIICSALQWLVDHRDAAARGSTTAAAAGGGGEGDGDEPDWMRDFTPLPPEKPTAKKGRPPAAAARSKARGGRRRVRRNRRGLRRRRTRSSWLRSTRATARSA